MTEKKLRHRYQKGRSMFDPYYSRIQELLFSGKSIKDTYEYVENILKFIAHMEILGVM